jgi:hypothetical protein
VKKVALVGFGAKTIRTYWPDDIEIWTINCAWDGYGFNRIDRLLEMHPIEQLTADLDRATKWEGKHWIWLQEPHPFPIYMMRTDPRIPASVEYPLDDICDDIFSHLWRADALNKYLTSSASFLMAMAIHEKYNTIYLAGFEMKSGSEFGYQRDGLAYLTGLANGRGIPVILPENTGFLKAKIYSYEGGQLVMRDVIVQHLENYQAQFKALVDSHDTTPQVYRAQGAVLSLSALLEKSSLPFMGRQGLEHTLQMYSNQYNESMGYVNKFGPEKFGPAMMMAEGAIQAYENLIEVCDLQEPDLRIHEIAHFIQLNKVQQEAQQ